MTQCDRILRHLKDHGTITQAQAMAEYGCLHNMVQGNAPAQDFALLDDDDSQLPF